MTKISMIIEGPESKQVSELINAMLLEVVMQGDVVLRKFDMNELSPEPRQRRNDMEIKIPEFLLERSRQRAAE